MTRVLRGIIHGKTIDLDENPGLQDGRQVEVTLRVHELPGARPGSTPGGAETERQPEPAPGVPPGIVRSQQAFWRALPELLQNKRNLGKWACYHGDERIGIGGYEDLIRECVRRGLADDAYDLDIIEPRAIPPWETMDIDGGGHIVDEMDEDTGSTGRPA